MAARTIVTSHPDVACDMCGRRLLRGEQPDVFLGAGQPRLVCELCTSRATQEGWRRETEEPAVRQRPAGKERGRSLLGGLRQRRRPSVEEAPAAIAAVEPTDGDDADMSVRRALETFNAGEHPRRVAGVTRSLGAPNVSVAQTDDTKVAIVVAWELCWYRYEIDLGDEAQGARLAAEGMELGELAAEDLLANAAADERGALSLLERV
ncbi:MAG: hypothetical protein ACRDLF_03680 [Solirubrobacteraceae bacterium]